MLKSMLAKIKHNHLLAMVLCCAIPLVAILVLSAMGVLGSWGYLALIFVCPLGHIFLMRGMRPASEKSRIRQRIAHNENRIIRKNS